MADWDYIGQCVDTVSVPVFGNGDVMNYEEYNTALEKGKVSGIMLARGALIKPWIFTEIKEQRHWDIRSGSGILCSNHYDFNIMFQWPGASGHCEGLL